MLETLESIAWWSFVQPPYNEPSSIPNAIRRLATPESEAEANQTYQMFLFAVGNNHAGTYFPVVLHTLPFLDEILRGPSVHARNATLDALIDLEGSFAPETGCDLIELGGAQRMLRDVLSEHMKIFVEAATVLALDLSADPKTRRLASELLELIEG